MLFLVDDFRKFLQDIKTISKHLKKTSDQLKSNSYLLPSILVPFIVATTGKKRNKKKEKPIWNFLFIYIS
jgi:hypothetical protein